ncbi:MAG: protein kinase [Pirellulales bacterium]
MSHITGIARAGYEPIPGYVLRQRLGAGGYGEVWSADAPGGLQKAVKLVYGSLDQHRASSELKSLQRIRQVHHPFLLSIERIEVIDGQLIIVSELAESSLMECFHAARRRQLQGIPRDQLLDFMRDAADALDYLSQKHDLQHLDVKPGNLLLMADRIKVADFGLIKDIHDPNVSMVSGLTPSHAAPEIFEGRPDRLSDLYSLAIVYEEMLTGKLPFDGKTAGELARQHLHQPPNLEPLPPADRRVVARALSKHPLDRYPSCKAFIEELRNSRSHEKYTVPAQARPEPETTASTGETQSELSEPTLSSTSTSPAASASLAIMPPLPVVDSAEGWQAPFCMFIGLGGIGSRSLTSLRSLMKQKVDNRRRPQDHRWLAIDTDFDLLSEVSSDLQPGALDYSDTMFLRLYRPQDYRERANDRFGPISRRWLYNIPRSLKTEGVRPLAMLAFLDHYQDVQAQITRQLRDLLNERSEREGEYRQPIRVYICASTHGGTGSALLSEIGLMVRRVLAQLKCDDYVLSALATVATTMGGGSGALAAAAGLACMNELQAHMRGGTFVPPLPQELGMPTVSQRPFDWVTLLEGGMHGMTDEEATAIDSISQALWIDSHTLIGATLDPVRSPRIRAGEEAVDGPNGWLRAQRSAIVQLGQAWRPLQVARMCCIEAFERWNSCLAKQNRKPSDSAVKRGESEHHILGWAPSQTEAVIEHLAEECLRALRFAVNTNGVPAEVGSMQNAWRNRVSSSPEAVRTQVERDVRAWRAWLGAQIRPTFVSWEHLHKVMLRAVDKLLTLADCDDETLLNIMQQDVCDEEKIQLRDVKAARAYIRNLAQKYLQQLKDAQPLVEQLSSTFNGWIKSVRAEQTMGGASGAFESGTNNMPLGWRHMLQRVHSVLDTTLQRFVVSRCFQSIRPEGSEESNPGCISLDHVLRLSTDLLTKLMREAGVDVSETAKAPRADTNCTRTMTLQEVQTMVPAAAQRGGKARRLLSVTTRQQSEMRERMQSLDMADSCTIVPAQFGEEPCAVCEAFDFSIARLAGNLWHPNSETLRLAERLQTRCDVSWPEVEEMLRAETTVPAF